jgi:hypothetical protein
MAIQPIDLQVLFTQIEKVAKAQNAQREGVAVQQAIHDEQVQRKTEEHMKAVNEISDTGEDGTEKIKDRESRGQDGNHGKKQEQEDPPEEEAAHVAYFSDPYLGKNIDISL